VVPGGPGCCWDWALGSAVRLEDRSCRLLPLLLQLLLVLPVTLHFFQIALSVNLILSSSSRNNEICFLILL
jgi:hypothetical protein